MSAYTLRVFTWLAAAGATAWLAATPAQAQLVAAGESGVVMGHVHVRASDVQAQKAFWAQLGGVEVSNGGLQMVRFPGVFIVLEQGTLSGGTIGSIMNHVGFNVKRMGDWLPRWREANIPMETPRPTQTYLMGPDSMRVEILEDTAQALPLRFHHLHYNQGAPLEIQDWYARVFGAVKGRRLNFDAADLPGVNLTFSSSPNPVVGTAGRVIDMVGFEVVGLEAFVRRVEASGVRFERGYQRMSGSRLATALLVDPWGTRIQLTEGITP
ncbi:MAG: VOC family protein [Gemmatimonadales bacterium]